MLFFKRKKEINEIKQQQHSILEALQLLSHKVDNMTLNVSDEGNSQVQGLIREILEISNKDWEGRIKPILIAQKSDIIEKIVENVSNKTNSIFYEILGGTELFFQKFEPKVTVHEEDDYPELELYKNYKSFCTEQGILWCPINAFTYLMDQYFNLHYKLKPYEIFMSGDGSVTFVELALKDEEK